MKEEIPVQDLPQKSAELLRDVMRKIQIDPEQKPNASIPRGGSQGTARPASTRTRLLAIGGGQRTARPTNAGGLIPKHWRWAVVGAINPNPIFNALAQFLTNGIHKDIAGLFVQFVLIAQTMIKEVALPFDSVFDRDKFFPVCNHSFHSRLARERDDGVQMVGHQQTKTAMPNEFVVVVFHRCENGVASVSVAELVLARRHAFDGDEKPTAFGDPLRDGVRQPFADGQIHVARIRSDVRQHNCKVGRAVLCPPRAWCDIRNVSGTRAARTE